MIKYNSENIDKGENLESTVAKVQFYNFPVNENKLDSTSSALSSMFVNRTDCHAQQYKNTKTDKWEFYKVIASPTVDKIKSHVKGQLTLGVYEIGLDDTVTWCCDDIDSHNGETDAREKVGRLVSTCRTYGVPFLLEASGSVDSYHLWIFLSQTRTYNAYRFIRQINSEAKVDCECWPKQKSIDNDRAKYGNLVKLPICYHQKSGVRSAFLDADSFESLEGPISHLGLVHLLEIPGLSESTVEGMPKAKRPVDKNTITNTTLDYCMQSVLEDKISLDGSEGHLLRLAIAVKAQHIGLTAEETAQLFQSQEDYDYELSLTKVQKTWSYNYSPWSCDTLRDKCGKLVEPYCRSCPFNHSGGEKSEASPGSNPKDR